VQVLSFIEPDIIGIFDPNDKSTYKTGDVLTVSNMFGTKAIDCHVIEYSKEVMKDYIINVDKVHKTCYFISWETCMSLGLEWDGDVIEVLINERMS
jgi:hypothetical protein